MTPAEQIAREFVKAYERLAPIFEHAAAADSWDRLPLKYRQLLVAVFAAMIKAGVVRSGCRSCDKGGSDERDRQQAR